MICKNADVAQLVERNLAKVEVAGSRPVIRSEHYRNVLFAFLRSRVRTTAFCCYASVPERPKGAACKAVQSRVQIPPGALLDPCNHRTTISV